MYTDHVLGEVSCLYHLGTRESLDDPIIRTG